MEKVRRKGVCVNGRWGIVYCVICKMFFIKVFGIREIKLKYIYTYYFLILKFILFE